MSRKLIVTDGRRERELLIVSRIVVGRDPTCDLSEADPLLSRRHAEFAVSGDDTVVRDLGSRNGIYVNGARIAEGTLQSGDVVRIGRLQMRYIEDSSPLVAVPELVDDATGIVFPGARGPAATPKPTPLPAASTPAADDEGEATSYAPASGVRKPPRPDAGGSSAHLAQSRVAQPFRSGSQPPPANDGDELTRVVPPPSRTGSPSPPPVIRTALQPPPSPPAHDGDEPTGFVSPRPRTAVQAPPAPPAGHTAVLPPPSPSADDVDEPTSFMTPRPRTSVQAPPLATMPSASARQARALAMAVQAIAGFLGSSPVGRAAADAVKALERDLANGAPPADLVNALKGLIERLGTAANELI